MCDPAAALDLLALRVLKGFNTSLDSANGQH